MKFTIVSHAGLLVESAGTSLMMDPWLVGSCYWRSWWNYPKPAAFASQLTELDYVYLTHMHWDHFHRPSLRKLPPSATLLIPEARIYKRMFATFSASKRLSIEIRKGATRDYLIFFQLLDMFEYDFFPLRKLFRPRFLKVWLRRWREVFDCFGLLARILFGRGDPLAKFVPRITTGSDSR